MVMAHLALDDAANAYNTALARNTPPLVAVVDTLDVSRATAGRLVKRARQAGLITDRWTRPHPRLTAVAHALNIDPAALRQAILDHADGDLRVDG